MLGCVRQQHDIYHSQQVAATCTQSLGVEPDGEYVQVAKAARRQEHVAVCAVQLFVSDSVPAEQSLFLLQQRPEMGLLAGDFAMSV